MRMLLTSGGLSNASMVSGLADLVGKPFSEAVGIVVVNAIVAMPGDKTWFLENLQRLHRLGWQELDVIDVASVPPGDVRARLRHADVIYVEGGFQDHLADVIERHDLVGLFRELIDAKVYVGSSAGSMIFSRHYDERSKVLLDAQPATAVFPFFSWYVKPHFNSPRFPERTDAWADRYAGFAEFPVYLIDDDSAVRVRGKLGDEVVDVVSEGEWRLVPAAE